MIDKDIVSNHEQNDCKERVQRDRQIDEVISTRAWAHNLSRYIQHRGAPIIPQQRRLADKRCMMLIVDRLEELREVKIIKEL